MDVAMASTAKAPSLKVHGDDGAQAIVHVGASVFIVQGISFGLNNTVNIVSPNVRRVTAQYSLIRFSTFGNLSAFILEWPQCTGNIRGLRLLVVDIDVDIQGRLGDVSLEGVCKVGVVGIECDDLSLPNGTWDEDPVIM